MSDRRGASPASVSKPGSTKNRLRTNLTQIASEMASEMHPTASPLPPLNSLPRILSLPPEILSLVSRYLDRPSALALARVSKAFTPIAEKRIYSELDLFLNPSYGEHPMAYGPPIGDASTEISPLPSEARKVEERHGEALREKVKRIMRNAGERQLGMVESVVAIPRSQATPAILSLLDLLSPNLKFLRLDAPAKDIDISLRSTLFETIDVKLLGYPLTFTSLINLHLSHDSVRFPETVLLLCRLSPQLQSLRAHLRYCDILPEWSDGIIPKPAGYDSPLEMPRLRRLQMTFTDREGNYKPFHPLVAILEASPNLQHVSLQTWCALVYEHVWDHLVRTLSEKQWLLDLHLNMPLAELASRLDNDGTEFPSLRRLVLDSEIPLDFLQYLHVERYYDDPLIPTPPTFYTEPGPFPTMLPQFAETLRRCPLLHTINTVQDLDYDGGVFPALEELEKSGPMTGVIRSFRHGEEELVHSRLFLAYFEISDQPRGSGSYGDECIEYVTRDGAEREKVYEERDEAEWHEATDFEGCKVPLEVIRRMRQIEGSSQDLWVGRGVEVGDQAWQYLREWKDRKSTGHADIRNYFRKV